ncbi:hypothetical protein [Viridibacillus sp. FSL H7-0596]|uniref:YqaI family protein n=1 Tax=Viridibacillus sp. FSL H7-0596 TaxID=1928923 RepID=UPI0009F8212A|nr:hypothetical protein [Viridibacillus sp. FSL H7-0596]
MADIEHPSITMACATGYPTRQHSEHEMARENDHSIEDSFGTEIQSGDKYFVIGDSIVLEDNIEDYLIEVLNAEPKQAE